MAVAPATRPARDEPARCVRGGRRAARIHEASGVRRGRGGQRRPSRAPPPPVDLMAVDQSDELRGAFLTAALTDEQRAEFAAAGERVDFDTGDVLFVEGE